jgi:hypothetical protein
VAGAGQLVPVLLSASVACAQLASPVPPVHHVQYCTRGVLTCTAAHVPCVQVRELNQMLKAWEAMRLGKDAQIAALMDKVKRNEEEVMEKGVTVDALRRWVRQGRHVGGRVCQGRGQDHACGGRGAAPPCMSACWRLQQMASVPLHGASSFVVPLSAVCLGSCSGSGMQHAAVQVIATVVTVECCHNGRWLASSGLQAALQAEHDIPLTGIAAYTRTQAPCCWCTTGSWR